MNSLRYCRTRSFMFLTHPPWPVSTAVAPQLDPSSLVEEEKTPYYDSSRFYPVSLGQILDGRYQIATKLGYGSSSTVWLARDLHRRWSREKYVALKINAVSHRAGQNAAANELAMLDHISHVNSKHEGWNFVRRLLGSFTVDGVVGTHLCLILERLREPSWLYCLMSAVCWSSYTFGCSQSHYANDFARTGLFAFRMADLKPDNILVKMQDVAILERDARDEYHSPLPQKITDERIIYLSRNDYGQFSKPTGIVQIADFGLSVSGKTPHWGCIQAEACRAPEVILDAGYSYSADIWSLGVMMWDLLEGKKLYDPIDKQVSGEYDDLTHLAQITDLLGPPPPDLLGSGQRTSIFYKPDGAFKHPELISYGVEFDNTVTRINGHEKAKFLEFVKKMIKWNPVERSTARDLLKDPWLY